MWQKKKTAKRSKEGEAGERVQEGQEEEGGGSRRE